MVLVTGATGLLGSHVVVDLLASGYKVKAMYRSEARKEVVYRLLRYYFPNTCDELANGISWFQGEIEDLVDVEDALMGVEKVVHCAALVSFHRRDFWKLFHVNRRGTANILDFAIAAGVKQFVHVSSTAAIGSIGAEDGVRRESDQWNAGERSSGYALSKYSAEKEVWRAQEEGLPVSVVNPSLMFGPGNWDESSLKILRTLKNGLRFYTKGANAFVDVRDVSKAICILLEAELTGERFLIAGNNASFKEFFDEASKQMQVKAPSVLAGPFLTGLAWRVSGIIARILGKRPTITKESAASSQRTSVYSSDKWLQCFPDFKFKSIPEMLENTIKGRMN